MEAIARILTVAEWVGVAILLVLMYRIAYFYQVSSNRPTRYLWFFAPMVLLLAGGLRYAMVIQTASDLIADVLMLAGGLALIVLGMNLLREMTGGRR